MIKTLTLSVLASLVVWLMEQEKSVAISGLKPHYRSADTIVFEIVNESDDTLYVYLGLDRKDENG